MTLQTGVGVSIAYLAETTFGTTPSTAGAQLIRNVSSGLNLTKDTYQSNERRSDYQVQDVRHGVRRVAGDIQGEASLGTYDAFIEAALRGTLTTGVTASQTDFTSITSNSVDKSFTIAGGSWITKGFRVGDVVQFTNLAATGNNGKNFRVVGLTATKMSVAETVVTDAVADTSFTVAVMGKKVSTGKVRRSFSIEHSYEDVDFSQIFTGVRIGGMKLALPPTGVSTMTFTTMGQDMQVLASGSSPYFASPSAPPDTPVLAAVDGKLRVGGTDMAVVTGLNIDLDLGLSADPVVGRNTVPEIFYGRTKITGSMTALIEDSTLLEYFANEIPVELHALINVPGSTNFFSVFLPKVKYTGGEIQNQGEQGLPINMPFQALLNPATSGYDTSTANIQILNA